MKTRKCYACGKRFESATMEKTPHKEWECESCFSERWEWCGVCQEHQLVDWNEPCRHIFWTDCGWMGCGGYDGDWPRHKKSLFAVFNKVGEACVSAMAKEIRSGGFDLKFLGSMIGSTGILLWADGQSWGDRFTNELTASEEKAMSLGVGWLNSLQPNTTIRAFEQTLEWIAEWEAARNLRLTIQFFRGGYSPEVTFSESQHGETRRAGGAS